MTSPQSSRRLNAKSMSFTGAIVNILENLGHHVEWGSPSVSVSKKDFDNYDIIIIGVAPPMSIASNNAFSALNMVDLLWDDERLRLLVDSPSPESILANLRAVDRESFRMFANFYAQRKQYAEVMSNPKVQEKIISATRKLFAKTWPTTLYPTTPWSDMSSVSTKLPKGAQSSLASLCIDSYYLSSTAALSSSTVTNSWAVDTKTTKWALSTMSSLMFPTALMKPVRTADDDTVQKVLSTSYGALISPTNNGAIPWSYRWAQAMNSGTPIASDWKITSSIGSSWSHLAAGIEEMSLIDRFELSVSQMADYLNAIPPKNMATNTLQTTLGIKNESTI
jgi:hypothetical protein